MHIFKSAILVTSVLLASSGVVLAQTLPEVTFKVEQRPTAPAFVSYSKAAVSPMPSSLYYVAYKVEITNNQTNTINHVRLEGIGADVGAIYPGNADGLIETTSSGVTCTGITQAENYVVTCNIVQLRGNANAPANGAKFTVFVRTPYVPPSPPLSPQAVAIGWKVYYAEGSNDSENSAGTDTQPSVSSIQTSVGLITAEDLEIKKGFTSVVPKNGGEFYTGNGAAKVGDVWVTKTRVPKYVDGVVIAEEFLPGDLKSACGAIALILPYDGNCYGAGTELTLPGTFDVSTVTDPTLRYLAQTLRRDSSTIPNQLRKKIALAKLFYQHTDTDNYVLIRSCFNGSVFVPPRAMTDLNLPGPCIYDRKAYPKNYFDAEYREDWEFIILYIENGRTQM
jgi:hypothetical protein